MYLITECLLKDTMPKIWECQYYDCGTHFNELPDGGQCPVCDRGELKPADETGPKWQCQYYDCGTYFNELPDGGECPTCSRGALHPASP